MADAGESFAMSFEQEPADAEMENQANGYGPQQSFGGTPDPLPVEVPMMSRKILPARRSPMWHTETNAARRYFARSCAKFVFPGFSTLKSNRMLQHDESNASCFRAS